MARSAKSRRTRHRGHAETSKKATEIDENPLKSEALDSAVLMHRGGISSSSFFLRVEEQGERE